jgi:hypothetical protein
LMAVPQPDVKEGIHPPLTFSYCMKEVLLHEWITQKVLLATPAKVSTCPVCPADVI